MNITCITVAELGIAFDITALLMNLFIIHRFLLMAFGYMLKTIANKKIEPMTNVALILATVATFESACHTTLSAPCCP